MNSSLKKKLCLALLILQPILFFWSTVIGLTKHIPYDIDGYHYPQIAYIAQCLAHGVLPLWDPYSYAGMPMHADLQAQLFYPPTWIVILFGNLSHGRYLFYWLEWLIPLHMMLAGVTMFILLRRMRLQIPTALLGASVFQLGSFFASLSQHLCAICSSAWLPLAALCVWELRHRFRLRWVAALAVAVAMSILAGFAASTMVVAGAVILFALALILLRETSWRVAGPLAAGYLWGALIAAAALIPLMTLTNLSIASLRSLWYTRGGGISLHALVSLLIPNYFHIFDLANYKLPDNFTFLYTYCGLVPLLLIVIAPFLRAKKALVFFGATVLAALWMLGEHTPVYGSIFPLLPRLLRGALYAEYAIAAFAFFAAITAAMGLDRVASRLPQAAVWALVLFTSADLIYTGGGRPMNSDEGGPRLGDAHRDDLEGTEIARKAFSGLADKTYPPARFDYMDTAFAQGAHGAGVLRIPTPTGDNPFMLIRIHRLRLMYASGNIWDRYTVVDHADSPLLSMLNVSYLASVRELPPAEQAKDGVEPAEVVHGVNIYRYPHPLPRFFLAPAIRKSAGEDDTFRLLGDRSFDPAATAIVEGIAADSSQLAVAPVQVNSWMENRVELTVAVNGPAFLASSETMYPGWEATVNDKPQPLLMTNGAFRGLRLQAGTNHIVMEYRPVSAAIAVVISLLAAIPAFGFLLFAAADGAEADAEAEVDSETDGMGLAELWSRWKAWQTEPVRESKPAMPPIPSQPAVDRGPWEWLAWAPLAVFIAFAAYELFGAVPIGMANNQDFARILGSLRLWTAADLADGAKPFFRYFVNDYLIHDPRWLSGVPSSEWLIAALAKAIGRWFLPHGTFKLQVMGFIHLSMFAAAISIFLHALRKRALWLRIFAGSLLVLIWADLEYIQQLSTAYTDAGALAALAILFAITVHGWMDDGELDEGERGKDWRWALGFTVAGSFLIATKTQHQTSLLALIPVCVYFAFRVMQKRDRIAWLLGPVVLVATAGWMIVKSPGDYRTPPAFTVVFYKIAPLSPDPKAVLADFHMPEDEFLKYVGHYWYESIVPQDDMKFHARILKLVSPSTLASFYLRHPATLSKIVLTDLHESAPDLKLRIYGHLRESDAKAGRTPFVLTAWSDFRTGLFDLAPNHLLWLIGFAIVFCVVCIAKPDVGKRWAAWPLVLFGLLLAVPSFAFASLLDAAETARHLLFFQMSTDLMLFSAIFAIALRWEQSVAVAGASPVAKQVAAAVAALLLIWLGVRYFNPSTDMDDTDVRIVYTGSWNHGTWKEAKSGTSSVSNDVGAKAKITFSGSEVTWIYAKAYNRGIASVKIDGVQRADVDQYDPKVIWQSKTQFKGLSRGEHTLELTVSGRKDSAATDQVMDVDSLVIR